MRKGKNPDPSPWLIDPDPGGPKTCRSCGSGSPTLWKTCKKKYGKLGISTRSGDHGGHTQKGVRSVPKRHGSGALAPTSQYFFKSIRHHSICHRPVCAFGTDPENWLRHFNISFFYVSGTITAAFRGVICAFGTQIRMWLCQNGIKLRQNQSWRINFVRI